MTEEFIRFECEKCNTNVKTPTENAGKRGKCPKCKHRMIIPEDEFIFDIEADFAEIDKEWDADKWNTGTKISLD